MTLQKITPINLIHYALVCVCICLSAFQLSGQSTTSIQRIADQYFEAGSYRNALQHYRQAGLENSKNKQTRLRVAISMYEINDIDGAARMLQALVNEGKTEAPVFLYLAKSYQARNLFAEAISNYKKFLQRAKNDDPLRDWVKDELTRCANGSRLKYAEQSAYVENAGPIINTQFSESGSRYSPTTIDKIYFNSDRNNDSDIYSTSLLNGKWSNPSQLPSAINSSYYNEVAGFSVDGQILYYLSKEGDGFEILTDTFSGEDGMTYKGIFNGPYNPDVDGTDIAFFNDSICLFASNKTGGYGGYDLYISVLKDGNWTEGINLGPAINSFYDERFPFLTRDGLSLFYSTNNLETMGGFDIFRADFDPQDLKWSLPENLGYPINSTLDDQHLVLSHDGLSGFISSNRKEGHGNFDLYRVFFKQGIIAHQQISYAPTFYQAVGMSGKEDLPSAIPQRPVEIKEYFISHLFIDENGDVLTPQNIKKLDLLANLLIIYPQIKAELSSFEIPSAQKTFNLYFSIKKAEQAADYLARKGVPKNRLLLKGYGSSFPLSINPGGVTLSPIYLKLNHRLEIGLHDFENEPVLTHIETIPVPENLLDPKGIKFEKMRHGFYFSVQIASITQILQNPNLEKLDEMFIEVNNVLGNYRYMIGILDSFSAAEELLNEMIQIGYNDAFIVPYLDGERLERNEMDSLTNQYPELMKYLENVKE